MAGRSAGGALAAILAAVAVAIAVAGCGLGLGGPAPRTTTTRAASGAGGTPGTTAVRATVARAQRTHEIPTPAPAQKAAWGWRSPVQAVQVFAQWYINWTADTVATHLRVLAQIGIGQARSAMALAAGQVAHDSALRLGGIANSGTVEAIAPVTGESNVYAVVTRERTTATHTNVYRGLRAGWHVTLATVIRVGGRLWTISGWQPEN
jgi:hypothetical protein